VVRAQLDGIGCFSADLKGYQEASGDVQFKAGEEIRTPDVQLGKLAFYH
jgi:hypothetical protein